MYLEENTVWRYVLLCLLGVLFYNDLFVRTKFFYSSAIWLQRCFHINLMYISNIQYRFFLWLLVSPWLGNTLLSLQEEKHPVFWMWKCKSGSAVIPSAIPFALDSLCKWVHTLKYTHENVWQDFPSVLALHKHIDIYRLWTTSDNVSLSKRITGNETVLILACVYTWSTLISHVCSEVLKNQGFWHYNLYGGKKRQGWKGDTLFYLINHFNISEGNLSPKP